jgi:acetyl-CoA acetyltransferase
MLAGRGGTFAVAGWVVTERGRRLGRAARDLRREPLDLALADAGLGRRDVDGSIVTSSDGFDDRRRLGLAPGFASTMQSGGATAIWSLFTPTLVGCGPADVHVGMRLQAVFEAIDGETVIPRFTRETTEETP